MTALNELLARYTIKLSEAGISSAQLDSLILLEDISGVDRTIILAGSDYQITSSKVKKLAELITRRAKHEPLSYIRGKSYFFNREFLVNNHTLEPRPETETMVELLLSSKANFQNIIDVGTGSGCLAITAKLELPDATVFATDISPECINTARQNAKILGAEVDFYQGNLLSTIPHTLVAKSYILLCNLPYVPEDWQINQAASFEPRIAIFGGRDGLDYYRQMFKQLKGWKIKPGLIFTESLPPQHKKLEAIAKINSYQLQKTQDFIQVFKLRI